MAEWRWSVKPVQGNAVGSNPTYSTYGVYGAAVSISACEAEDSGSNPGKHPIPAALSQPSQHSVGVNGMCFCNSRIAY